MIIVIEGNDFSGKSSVADALRRNLKQEGLAVVPRRGCLTGPLDMSARALQRLRPPGRNLLFHLIFVADSLIVRARPAGEGVTVCEVSPIRVAARDLALGRDLPAAAMLWAQRAYDRVADYRYFLDADFDTRRGRWLRSPDAHDPTDERRFADPDGVHRSASRRLDRLAEEHGYVRVPSPADCTVADVVDLIVSDLKGISTT